MSRVKRMDVLEALPAGVALTPREVHRRLFLVGDRMSDKDVFALSGAQRWRADFPEDARGEDDEQVDEKDDGEESPAQLALVEDESDEDPETLAEIRSVTRHLNWLAKNGFATAMGDSYELNVEHVRARTDRRGKVRLTGSVQKTRPRPAKRPTAAAVQTTSPSPTATTPSYRKPDSELTPHEYFVRYAIYPDWRWTGPRAEGGEG